MQRNKISFNGQKIFVGIDVHKKNWDVAIAPEIGNVKRHSQKASAVELFDFLKKHYPDGDYQAVYESGFSGFSTYYALKDVGINCMVIHAADVPTTQYEEIMKTDKVDSVKLVRSLKAGLLKGIYIREKGNIDDRSVIRIRKTILRDLNGYKSRVKHLLHCNGVILPDRFDKPGSHWSKAFIKWLKEDVELLSSSRNSLDILIHQVETIRMTLLEATRMVRWLSQTERYKHNFDLLRTIPGIGVIVSMCILTEIYDVKRFHNEREFAAYLGLIPTSHSSGEKIVHGEKTFRGNKQLGPMIIEAAWIAIYRDAGLGSLYLHYKERMKPQEAIVRIARKLSNIIFAILKTKKEYVPYSADS
ncbi:MAG: IS110 family transposase [Coprobacter sp.]|nr:IS110 family transposase [Coprobacter sp.]